MALISLQEATRGLIRTGGRQSLNMGSDGLLNTGDVVVQTRRKSKFLMANVGGTGRGLMAMRRK